MLDLLVRQVNTCDHVCGGIYQIDEWYARDPNNSSRSVSACGVPHRGRQQRAEQTVRNSATLRKYAGSASQRRISMRPPAAPRVASPMAVDMSFPILVVSNKLAPHKAGFL